MFKRPEFRLAVLGVALIASTLAWYLIAPLFTSRETYSVFPTLAVMASPTPRPATSTPTTTPEAVGMTQLVAAGTFVDVAYSGTGSAEIYELPGGTHVLSLENFAVDPGPELHVLVASSQVEDSFTDEHLQNSVDLGLLLATEGEQQYDIPEDLLPSELYAIVIWCEPEQVTYIIAHIQPVAEQAAPES